MCDLDLDFTSMKIVSLLVYVFAGYLIKYTEGSAIHAPLDVISYEDISPEDRKELDYLQHKLGRPKRSGSGSGSGDILESLKLAIGQGIKNKIGELAKGSAAATARLSSSSSSSSGSGYYHHHSPPHPPESYDHKSLDFWSLKKSILNTLLQAVKAIKGGVIAVKGQLIKGSGYLTAATGKLIVAKGDAVTDLGKKIAASAVLVPYHGHSSSGHADYGSPPESHHYSAPSAPEDFYHGSPSAPGPEFHEPQHHYPYHDDDASHKGPSGLLVLKKIHGDQHYHHHHHTAEESKVPPFKSLEPSGPSFGTIVGKFLSASSSLDPHKPQPFGHTASGDNYHSHSHQYEVAETKNHHHKVKPSASGYVVNEDPPEDPNSSPFEKEPSYLSQHFDEHIGSSSKKNPGGVKPLQDPPKSDEEESNHYEINKPSTSAQTFVKPEHDHSSSKGHGSGVALSSSATYTKDFYNNLPVLSDYPDGFPSSPIFPSSSSGELPASVLGQTGGQNLYYPSQSPSAIDLTQNYVPPSFDAGADGYIGQSVFSNEILNYHQHFPVSPQKSQDSKPSVHPHTPHLSRRPTRLTHFDSASSSSKTRSKSTRPKPKYVVKRPPSSTRITTTKHKPKQTYDVVKSIAYELGPNGPKRLT